MADEEETNIFSDISRSIAMKAFPQLRGVFKAMDSASDYLSKKDKIKEMPTKDADDSDEDEDPPKRKKRKSSIEIDITPITDGLDILHTDITQGTNIILNVMREDQIRLIKIIEKMSGDGNALGTGSGSGSENSSESPAKKLEEEAEGKAEKEFLKKILPLVGDLAVGGTIIAGVGGSAYVLNNALNEATGIKSPDAIDPNSLNAARSQKNINKYGYIGGNVENIEETFGYGDKDKKYDDIVKAQGDIKELASKQDTITTLLELTNDKLKNNFLGKEEKLALENKKETLQKKLIDLQEESNKIQTKIATDQENYVKDVNNTGAVGASGTGSTTPETQALYDKLGINSSPENPDGTNKFTTSDIARRNTEEQRTEPLSSHVPGSAPSGNRSDTGVTHDKPSAGKSSGLTQDEQLKLASFVSATMEGGAGHQNKVNTTLSMMNRAKQNYGGYGDLYNQITANEQYSTVSASLRGSSADPNALRVAGGRVTDEQLKTALHSSDPYGSLAKLYNRSEKDIEAAKAVEDSIKNNDETFKKAQDIIAGRTDFRAGGANGGNAFREANAEKTPASYSDFVESKKSDNFGKPDLAFGDSTAFGLGLPGDSKEKRSPSNSLKATEEYLKNNDVKGKKVVVSGMSNDLSEGGFNAVKTQIEKLKAAGADVTLMGGGERKDIAAWNPRLEQLSKDEGIPFTPMGKTIGKNSKGEPIGDGIHPLSYSDQMKTITETPTGRLLTPEETKTQDAFDQNTLKVKSTETTAGGQADPGLIAAAHALQNDPQFKMFTALKDKFHVFENPASKHNQGLAYDAAMKDGDYDGAYNRISEQMTKAGFQEGKDFWLERGTRDHAHFQWQNKEASERYASMIKQQQDPAASFVRPKPKYENPFEVLDHQAQAAKINNQGSVLAQKLVAASDHSHEARDEKSKAMNIQQHINNSTTNHNNAKENTKTRAPFSSAPSTDRIAKLFGSSSIPLVALQKGF